MIIGSAYRVRNLDQTIHFYTKVLGMSVLATDPDGQQPNKNTSAVYSYRHR